MKKYFLFLGICTALFANKCDEKIKRLNKELEFANTHNEISKKLSLELALKQVKTDCEKDPLFYDKKLEIKNTKEQELEKIEKELKELKAHKDHMSKDEYKAKKQSLKEQKDKIKKETQEHINSL